MNEEMRKEFEEWIIKSNATWRVPNFIMKNDNGAYIDPQTSYLWISWQASREAMKPIKLPKSEYVYHVAQHEMTAVIDLNECREAIKLAGYKVEE